MVPRSSWPRSQPPVSRARQVAWTILGGQLVNDGVEAGGVLLGHVPEQAAVRLDPDRIRVIGVGRLTDQLGSDERDAHPEGGAATGDGFERVLVVALAGGVNRRAEVERG